MGLPVIIYGKSGSGKSRSMKNFGEEEVMLINVEKKALPFRNKFKYVLTQIDVTKKDIEERHLYSRIDKIIWAINSAPCNAAVVDDAGYLMTQHFMNNHKQKQGNKSFEMYDEIADQMYQLIEKIKSDTPDDKIVYIMLHEDTDDFGSTKLRTIGKLLDNKVCLEGMVTICLRCMSSNGKHFFLTQTKGSDITKTPEDMFAEEEIDNDLQAVDQVIRNYYGMNGEKEK